MSAGEDEPGILESIEEDVKRIQREEGRRPTGTLRPETEQALQEQRIEAAQQRVARRAPTASTITRRSEDGEITIEPAKRVEQEPDVEALESDGRRTVLIDRGGDPTLRQKLRREVSPGLGPVATEENIEELRRGEERLIERGGLPAALFAGGETISRFGAGISGGVQDILPLEDVGPAISVPGFEAEAPVGKQFERGVGGLAGGIPILAGQIPQALAGAPTLVEQAEEEGVGEVGGRFGEQLQVGATQTATQFARNPVEAGVLIGAAAGARPAVRAARSPRAAARGARESVVRAPGRARAGAERALDLPAETRARAGRTRESVEGTLARARQRLQEAKTREETVLVEPRATERGTREFEVEPAPLRSEAAGERVPLEQITRVEGEPITQTTLAAFEEPSPGEAARIGLVEEGRAPPPRELTRLRRVERGTARRSDVVQETLGGERIPVEERVTEFQRAQEVPETGEFFEVTPTRFIAEERIAAGEAQVGLPAAVVTRTTPTLFGRLLGERPRVDVRGRSEAAEAVLTEQGARAQLQLLGRESRQARARETGEFRVGEGFEFRRVEEPRFEVEGGGLEALERPVRRPGFEFGLERTVDVPFGFVPVTEQFGEETTVAEDVGEELEQELADVREVEERRRVSPVAAEVEGVDVLPEFGFEERGDVGLGERELVGERTSELVAPREDVVPLEDTLIGEDVTTDLTTDITTTTDIVPEPDIPPPIVPTPDTPGPRVPPPPGGLLGAAGRGRGDLFGFLFGRVFENPIELDILDDDEEGEGIDLV